MDNAFTPLGPAPADTRRNWRERLALLCGLLVVAALLGWGRWIDHGRIETAERERLASLALVTQSHLAQQVAGLRAALAGLRTDLSGWPEAERPRRATQRLRAISEAVPLVRTMHWLDAEGRMVASSVAQAVGTTAAGAERFERVRKSPDPDRLYVSAPFRTPSGLLSVNLVMMVSAADGGFGGVVAATLDPAYLARTLHDALYADDMRAALAHGDGQVFLLEPPVPEQALLPLNVSGQDSLFSRHLGSGQAATVQRGTGGDTSPERLMAQHTLQPGDLAMDAPLVVAYSRDAQALFEPWRRQTAVDFALLFVGAGGAWLLLLALQRRHGEFESLGRAAASQRERDTERLGLALRGADLALWDSHVPSRQGVVNERWYSMLGLAPATVGPDETAWRALVHPADLDHVLAAQDAHLAGRSAAYEAVYRMRHSDGHWVWVLDRGRIVQRDAAGQPLRMVGTHLDITERMEAEAALRLAADKSRALLDSLGSGVVVHDAATRVVDANPAACAALGLTLERMRGLGAEDPAWRFVEEDHEPMPLARYPVNQLRDGGALPSLTLGVLHPGSSEPKWLVCSGFVTRTGEGAVDELVVTFTDITERKRAQEALELSERRHRTASRMARLGGWRVELPSRAAVLAPELVQIVGRAAPGPLPQALRVGDDAQRARLEQRIERCIGDGLAFDIELEARTADGRAIELRVLGEPLRDAGGRLVALQGAAQDVSESRRAQQLLRLLQAAVARLNDMVLITEAAPLDEPGPRIVFVNNAFERFTGYRSDEVLGKSPRLLQGPDTSRAELDRIGQALQRGQSVRAELVNYHRSGRAYWVDIEIVPLTGNDGRVSHLVAVQRDISERKGLEAERQALERQLLQAQKMESIGTLAGGIAHDFNNILPAILGNAALARADLATLGEAHPALRSLEQINKAALRARSLVQQILTFSRHEPKTLEPQPLQPVVEETLALLRASLPAGVRLDVTLPAEPLVVMADATQLQQVVMNLCTNAWHALPQGRGRVEVGLAAQADERGRWARLWVRDDGVGIDEATRERIFDPFFTTKPVGRGTGLGLSVVHGIVRGHGGRIDVDSAPGHGSTFCVWLPLHAAAGAAAPDPTAADAAGGGQRLLYVDDDELMVMLVQSLLERAGYTVHTSSGAAAALAWLAAQPQPPDLVITDYNMPEASGLELTARLRERHPGLPVIVSSGNIGPELREQAHALGVQALLEKQHTMEALPGLVQRVLAEAASRAGRAQEAPAPGF